MSLAIGVLAPGAARTSRRSSRPARARLPGARGRRRSRDRERAQALRARAGGGRRGAVDQSQGLRRSRGVRSGAGARARQRAAVELVCHAGLHADPLAGLRAGLRRATPQHPSLAAAGLPRPARPAAGARPRRQGRRAPPCTSWTRAWTPAPSCCRRRCRSSPTTRRRRCRPAFSCRSTASTRRPSGCLPKDACASREGESPCTPEAGR